MHICLHDFDRWMEETDKWRQMVEEHEKRLAAVEQPKPAPGTVTIQLAPKEAKKLKRQLKDEDLSELDIVDAVLLRVLVAAKP